MIKILRENKKEKNVKNIKLTFALHVLNLYLTNRERTKFNLLIINNNNEINSLIINKFLFFIY